MKNECKPVSLFLNWITLVKWLRCTCLVMIVIELLKLELHHSSYFLCDSNAIQFNPCRAITIMPTKQSTPCSSDITCGISSDRGAHWRGWLPPNVRSCPLICVVDNLENIVLFLKGRKYGPFEIVPLVTCTRDFLSVSSKLPFVLREYFQRRIWIIKRSRKKTQPNDDVSQSRIQQPAEQPTATHLTFNSQERTSQRPPSIPSNKESHERDRSHPRRPMR